jgi:hypothetical protein
MVGGEYVPRELKALAVTAIAFIAFLGGVKAEINISEVMLKA